MRFSLKRLALALTCFVLPTALASHAFADTYDTYIAFPGTQGNVANLGLTDQGTLTTLNFSDLKYTVFTPPSTYTTSTLPPALSYDNGTLCNVPENGYIGILNERCNGDRTIFQAQHNQSGFGLYLAQAGLPVQLLYTGPVSGLLLNSYGDIAFFGLNQTNPNGDTDYLLYNTTTHVSPEPSSFVMLGTGLVGVAGALRRLRRRR